MVRNNGELIIDGFSITCIAYFIYLGGLTVWTNVNFKLKYNIFFKTLTHVSPHVCPHVCPHVFPHVCPHVSPHVCPRDFKSYKGQPTFLQKEIFLFVLDKNDKIKK